MTWQPRFAAVAALAALAGPADRAIGVQEASAASVRVGLAHASGGYSVASVPLEIYVARVLGGEAAPNTPPAALEALAIAIRTYALVNAGRHRADGFDLCDQTHCQVLRAANAGTERAARATAGQALLRAGVPAPVYYSASCGGRTEMPSAVWPGAEDPSYLPVQDDAACGGEPVWTADLSRDELWRALAGAGFRGRLRNMRVLSRGLSGRVARLALDGATPSEISAQELRMAVSRTMGPLHIKSAAFELRRDGDRYRFNGRGYGHGVGMCVTGSMRLAEAGVPATAILARYYPGLVIGTAGVRKETSDRSDASTADGITVVLPDEDAAERGFIAAVAARARDEVAQLLATAAPPVIALRFYSSVTAYERGTGRPWFTLGTLSDGEIRLLPVPVLRERGVLERTVRHEVVHVLTDRAVASRPEWVREGLGLYYAEPGGAASPRLPCPTNAELQAPASAGAYTEAAARARACVARQLQAGRAWRDVR